MSEHSPDMHVFDIEDYEENAAHWDDGVECPECGGEMFGYSEDSLIVWMCSTCGHEEH